MVLGAYWNQPVCPSIYPSSHPLVLVFVCVQNTSFWQKAGWGINPLPDDKILDWSKLKQIVDDILKCI